MGPLRRKKGRREREARSCPEKVNAMVDQFVVGKWVDACRAGLRAAKSGAASCF